MRPLIAALVVAAVVVTLTVLAVRFGGSSGGPQTPETFNRVSVRPLETTIELTR